MRNKMFYSTMLAVAITLTLAIPTQVSAKEQQIPLPTGRSQAISTLDLDSEAKRISLVEADNLPMSETVDPEEVISVSEGADSVLERRGIQHKYGWSCGNDPYTFTQTWSTNREIYLTYPFYDDGWFYPAATELLDFPSDGQYETAVREGYVNDSWATQYAYDGLHAYYHTVTSDEQLNSVTVLLDENVGFQVFDMELQPVIDGESPAYSNLLLYYRQTLKHNGSNKIVHTLKLAAGNYLIMFWDNGGKTGNYHYAMFTGNPLPIEKTYFAGSAFNGSIQWDGYSSSQTYQASGVTVSIDGGVADLLALYRVRFQDTGTASFNQYIDSAEMMYQSPNSGSYKTIANIANLRQDMVDSFPDAGSIVGTYNTRVKVNWWNNLANKNASYFTSAILYIDYLVPFGEVNISN